MKMKVHFIIPPIRKGERIPERVFGCNYGLFFQPNIYVLYCATLLRENGVDVEVTDCIIENKSLKGREGDIFVLYSVFLSREVDVKVTKWLLEKHPNSFVVFIGSDPTSKPENYLMDERCFVCRGEPEYVLLDIVKELNKKKRRFSNIKSLSWFKKKKVINNKPRPYIKNIDELPIPDRKLLKKPFEYYNSKFKKFPMTNIIMSRGCAFNCLFCVPGSLNFARELEWKKWHDKKPPVTLRSPKNIEKECQEIYDLGYRALFVLDDEFVWGEKRSLDILNRLKKFDFDISLLARCDMLNRKIAQKFKEVGVSHVDLGVESYNQDILNYVRKNQDVRTINKAVGHLKEAGIEPEINVLIGSCPLETKETVKDTLDKVTKLNVEIVHTKICAPFPGTDFNKVAKEKGWMTVPEYVPIDPASESLISYPHLTDKEMVKIVREFYRKHYFSPKYLAKHLFSLKSLEELKNKTKTAFAIYKTIINPQKRK